MRLPALLVADPHFTANVKDEYRWGLFAWMRAQIKERGVKSVAFLGDLTDAKDFHPSALVNRLAAEMRELSSPGHLRTYMIPGNHEWLKQGEEFWRFLQYMNDRIAYFTRPSDDPWPGHGPTVHFLPFTKNPAKDWSGLDFSHYDFLFMHQTLKGARASNGDLMEGEDLPDLSAAAKVYSGDIHVPQIIGPVEYVGSPYHVHFGDSFEPRCVLLHEKGALDLHFPTISRVTLTVHSRRELERKEIYKGDQVKLRVELEEADKFAWKSLRRDCISILHGKGAEVHGVELVVRKQRRRLEEGPARRAGSRPEDEVLRYVQAEELGAEAFDAGLEVIES